MPAAWAAGISAVGSLASGLLSSSGTSDAANTANGISQATIDEAKTNYSPYTSTGSTANTQLANLTGINGQDAANSAMSTFQSSPGYSYTVQQGLRAVDDAASSKGMARSGSTIKAEETLGSNLANQNYQSYVNTLSGLSNTGLNATSGYENVASGQSTSQQNTTTGAASTNASIYGNTASGLTNAAGLAYKNNLFGTSSGSVFDSSGTGGTTAGSTVNTNLSGVGPGNSVWSS